MTADQIVQQIEDDQKDRFAKREASIDRLLHRNDRRKLKRVSDLVKSIFVYDYTGHLTCYIDCFQATYNTTLTLQQLNHLAKTTGKNYAIKKVTIKQFLEVVGNSANELDSKKAICRVN